MKLMEGKFPKQQHSASLPLCFFLHFSVSPVTPHGNLSDLGDTVMLQGVLNTAGRRILLI